MKMAEVLRTNLRRYEEWETTALLLQHLFMEVIHYTVVQRGNWVTSVTLPLSDWLGRPVDCPIEMIVNLQFPTVWLQSDASSTGPYNIDDLLSNGMVRLVEAGLDVSDRTVAQYRALYRSEFRTQRALTFRLRSGQWLLYVASPDLIEF
jgi:hypothetical protein